MAKTTFCVDDLCSISFVGFLSYSYPFFWVLYRPHTYQFSVFSLSACYWCEGVTFSEFYTWRKLKIDKFVKKIGKKGSIKKALDANSKAIYKGANRNFQSIRSKISFAVNAAVGSMLKKAIPPKQQYQYLSGLFSFLAVSRYYWYCLFTYYLCCYANIFFFSLFLPWVAPYYLCF